MQTRWSTLVALATAALSSILVATALAASPAMPTSAVGRRVTQVKMTGDAEPVEVTSHDFADVPGISRTISVRPNTQAVVLARFSAEGACTVGGSDGCRVRIRIGDAIAEPASNDFYAAIGGGGGGLPNPFSMERYAGPLPPGTYTVQVQAAIGNATIGSVFTLDDWTLVVERVST